jgi:hypothetical protein
MNKIYGIPVATPINPNKFASGGNNTLFYKEETSTSAGGTLELSHTATHDWTEEFSAVPKKDDLVISASGQMFLVLSATDTLVTLSHLNNLGSSEADAGVGALTSWEIVQSSDAVTLNYTLEDGSEHTDVITFDANGYPVSIAHDGVAAPGAWREADV